MKPGARAPELSREMDRIAASVLERVPRRRAFLERNNFGAEVVPLRDLLVGGSETALSMLAAAVSWCFSSPARTSLISSSRAEAPEARSSRFARRSARRARGSSRSSSPKAFSFRSRAAFSGSSSRFSSWAPSLARSPSCRAAPKPLSTDGRSPSRSRSRSRWGCFPASPPPVWRRAPLSGSRLEELRPAARGACEALSWSVRWRSPSC